MLQAPELEEIRNARKRIAPFVYRTPLVPLHGWTDVYLKLENLQPVGSFKIRGAGNAMELAGPDQLRAGVFTASAGNMAQGVAWNARRLGIRCTSVVPEHAPQAKTAALERMNCEIIRISFDEWWNVLMTGHYAGVEGFFIHPVCDAAVIAGNGTIGLEILEDLPDVQTILIPYGGGGLSCGIASAVRALNPAVKIFACEVGTAAPLSASLAAGKPVSIDYTPSFIDGIGGKSVLPEMWHLVSCLLNGSRVVTVQEIADAIRLLAERNHVIAEGAGAASVAAATQSNEKTGKTVCVISGGNIDSKNVAAILNGLIPS